MDWTCSRSDTWLGDLSDCDTRVSPASCLLAAMEKKEHLPRWKLWCKALQSADVTLPLPPTSRFITGGSIAPRPNISVDREKVGVVYYWTGWCIDRPGLRPDFGGLATLPSSLSFPQHQSRWLQLPTDQRCNGLMWRRKARRRPQNMTCGEVGDFCYRAEQIDRRDAVMSDLPRGRGENLYPVRAHWRSEARNKWKCCFFFTPWFPSS